MSGGADELAALRARIAALEGQARRSEWILRASLEGFHVVSTQGVILDCNDAFAGSLGYARDELLGAPIARLDRRPRAELDALTDEMIRRGAVRFVTHHFHRDGHPVDVEVSVHFVDLDGERFFAAFSHPITERLARERALRASEAKLRAVFDRTALLIALLTPAGALVELNRRLAALVGPRPDAPPSDFWDMPFWTGDGDRREVAALVRDAAAGASRSAEVSLTRADGGLAHVALQIGPIADDVGRPALLLAEGFDVTDLRRAEAEREAIHRQLLAAQEETIRDLGTPLIPLEADILVAPLVGRIDRERAANLRERLLTGVVARRARAAILDVTGVPVIDAEVAAALVQAAQAVRLLGAEPILTGLRPELAAALVDLGLDLRGLATCGTLQDGLRAARARRPRPR